VRRAIGSANLVKYLLPDSKGFQTWFKRVVQRLPALSTPSARNAGFLEIQVVAEPPAGVSTAIFGAPVPREAYDPDFDLAAADPAALIDAMLVRIAAQANPFLFSAAEVTAAGFPGRPYRYPS